MDALTNFYLILTLGILDTAQKNHANFHMHPQLLPVMLKSTPRPRVF